VPVRWSLRWCCFLAQHPPTSVNTKSHPSHLTARHSSDTPVRRPVLEGRVLEGPVLEGPVLEGPELEAFLPAPTSSPSPSPARTTDSAAAGESRGPPQILLYGPATTPPSYTRYS